MTEYVKTSFPDRLKDLRTEKKINQAQLAADLKIGRASISNYEIGSRLPDAEVIVALADYFNVSTDYLLGRTSLPTGTIDSTDKMILRLSERVRLLSPVQKDELFRFLKCISEMLDVDKCRGEYYSVFTSYASIMEFLCNFDQNAAIYISNFLLNRKDEKEDLQAINTIENMKNYYCMVDKVRESALATAETISHILRTDVVLCLTGSRDLLNEWIAKDIQGEINISDGDSN